MRGARQLSVDGVALGANVISGIWLSDSRVAVRDHATGQVLEGEVSVPAGAVTWEPCPGRRATWLAGPTWEGAYAWAVVEADGTAVVRVTDGREFRGFGAGMRGVALSWSGWLLMARQADGRLLAVAPGQREGVWLDGAVGTSLEAGEMYGVYRGVDGRLWSVSWMTLEVVPVADLGEEEFWPVLVDTPEGPWVLSHTHDRLLLRPLRMQGTDGYEVAYGGNSFYPHARWVAGTRSIRVAWSTGLGVPMERTIDLAQPRVALTGREHWAPTGTVVDTMPFHVPTFTGVLRASDGQTLQMVRTGPREVRCLKGRPERQEIWQWDDETIWLVYDASDKEATVAVTGWQLDPVPVWCRRMARVGEVWEFAPGTVLRRSDGDVHPFTGRTSVWGVGERVRVGRLGRCRVLVTTWEVGPPGVYQERHWWAIGEEGTRWGRVRYQEYREGRLTRDFVFDEVVEAAPPEVVPPLPIPRPAPAPPTPPRKEPEMLAFPPRNETLEFLDQLNVFYREELQREPVTDVHVDREGLAVWVQEYLRWRTWGRSHEEASRLTLEEVKRAAGLAVPPPLGA